MSFTFISTRVVPALLCGALLAACDDAPEEQPSKPAIPRAGTKGAGLAPEMVAAASAGRSATMIGLHFAIGDLPVIGKPLPVAIAVVPHIPFSSVNVYFEARDGMALSSGNQIGPLTDVLPGKTITHDIVLQPLREGVYTVTATVDTEGTEGSITRVFSIPVIVGPPVTAVETPAPAPAPAPESSAAAPTEPAGN
jgi:hypothetical protein